jgi:hypothetical protein
MEFWVLPAGGLPVLWRSGSQSLRGRGAVMSTWLPGGAHGSEWTPIVVSLTKNSRSAADAWCADPARRRKRWCAGSPASWPGWPRRPREAEQLLVNARRALHRALRRAQVKAVEQFAGWDAGIACAGRCAGAALRRASPKDLFGSDRYVSLAGVLGIARLDLWRRGSGDQDSAQPKFVPFTTRSVTRRSLSTRRSGRRVCGVGFRTR